MHKNPGNPGNRWMSILAMLAVAALVGAVGLFGAQQPEAAHAQDDDAPTITSLEFTSSPASGDAYLFGETIQVTVTFDEAVKVHESHDGVHGPDEDERVPGIVFLIGNLFGRYEVLEYTSGSGTDALVFEFTLDEEYFVDPDGLSVLPSRSYRFRTLDNWTGAHVEDIITSVATGTLFNHLHDGIDHSPDHKVLGRPSIRRSEGIVSTPASGDTYGVGENIEIGVTYNWPVEVEGDKFLGLRIGVDRREAAYNRGSGTETLVFRYEVQPGDFDDDGISSGEWVVVEEVRDGFISRMSVGEAYGYSGSGTIKAVGTDLEVMPEGPFQPDTAAHKVDGVAPTISSIGFTNASGDDNTYGVGDTITVYVNFSEDVLTLGAPQLTLDFDGTEKTATYYDIDAELGQRHGLNLDEIVRIARPHAMFTYTVRVGDTDADGIAVSANALALNGGSIQDAAGNDADISHDALSSNAAHMVSAPGGL